MERRRSVLIDAYVLDVLLRDLVGRDKPPAAFIVCVHLHGLAARRHWRPVAASLRDLADHTGLSKSSAQTAMNTLRRRELIASERQQATATPRPAVVETLRGGRPTRHFGLDA